MCKKQIGLIPQLQLRYEKKTDFQNELNPAAMDIVLPQPSPDEWRVFKKEVCIKIHFFLLTITQLTKDVFLSNIYFYHFVIVIILSCYFITDSAERYRLLWLQTMI